MKHFLAATALLLASQTAMAGSGFAPVGTRIDPANWPNGLFLLTQFDPTLYCWSAQDAGGPLAFRMESNAVFYSLSGLGSVITNFKLGLPPSGWGHGGDCPSSVYIYGISLYNQASTGVFNLKLDGDGQPACMIFQQTGQSGTFGASVNDANAGSEIDALTTNLVFGGGALSYSLGGSNAGDCPLVDTYVSNVATH